MGGTLLIAAFGAGVFQAIFLCATVILRPQTNRRAARFLSILLAVMAVGLFAQIVQDALNNKTALLVAFLNINTELVVGPLIFLAVRSLLFADLEFGWRDVLHFLPMAIGVIAWTAAWFQVVDHAALYSSGFHTEFPVLEYLFVKAGILYAYLFLAYRMLAGAARRRERLYSARHSVPVRTVQRSIVGLGTTLAAIYLLNLTENFGVELPVGPDQFGGILLTSGIFMIGSLFITRPWVLSLRLRSIGAERQQSDTRLLQAFLRERRPWIDPKLSRLQLAAALGWSESHLSSIIRIGLESGFYDVLNRYRLEEFERLAREPARRRDSVLVLALDSGFNSKAAFYRAFRDKHRTTPTRFRSRLLAGVSAKASH